jgi:hypothetical protein
MNGRDLLLVLAHLFRKKGNPVDLERAVEFLSFRCRYGPPSAIRKLLTIAEDNEMISLDDALVKAEFLFDKQVLSPNLASAFEGKA